MSLDRSIFKAIKGHTEDKPQDLVGILAYVDSREKLLLTHEELSGGLERLIRGNQIAEVVPHKFVDTAGRPYSHNFSRLSLSDHEQACQAYRKWFEEQCRLFDNRESSEDDFSRQKVVIRWKLSGSDYATDDDEDSAEVFADQIEPILNQSHRAEVNGFEFGPGYIDILIFGKETDDDTDEIYADIVSAFRSFGCPPGSCIIREYEGRGEVVSDTIPGGDSES
jgi:hypothetical protein